MSLHSELSTSDIFSLNIKHAYRDFFGLRVRPKCLNFKNVFEGQIYRQHICLQNVASKPIFIRTKFPSECCFKLENPVFGVSLSPGLIIKLWIHYTHLKNANLSALLNIYANDHCLNYCINVCMTGAYIYTVPRVINFGKINLAHSVYTETLYIHNKGYKTSKFEFDLASNPLGLLIKPTKGFVEPTSKVAVEISIVGIEEGQFYKEVWVKCDQPFRFAVVVEIVKPKLYICGPYDYTESFLPIKFPPMYANCKHIQTLTIFNYNLLDSNYIVVPEFNMDVMALHKVKELEPSYKSFNFMPVDGRLQPNEKKNITISFHPSKTSATNDRIFFVCYRLTRLEIVNVNKLMIVKAQKKVKKPSLRHSTVSLIDVTSIVEISESEDSASCKSIDFGENIMSNYQMNTPSFAEYIRLCLYAVVKPVQVTVKPTGFDLGKMMINTTKTRYLYLYNNSTSLPIYFNYIKTAYIDVYPMAGQIGISGNVRIDIAVSPKRPGKIDGQIKFHLLYTSCTVENGKELSVVGTVIIPIDFEVFLTEKYLQPEYNIGITPKITNEVGYLTDDVRFNTNVKFPKMTILEYYKQHPENKFNNAIIAVPNDRPTSLRPWRNQTVECKTIFAGVSRVIAPIDIQTMLTLEEVAKKRQNLNYFQKYLLKCRINRLKQNPPKKQLPDYIDNETKLLMQIKKPSCSAYMKNVVSTTHEGFPSLTPIQTYFVHIKPLKISVGKVVLYSKSKFEITVENDNKFPCLVELKTLYYMDARIFPGLPKSFVLKGSCIYLIEEEFHAFDIGSFNTILNIFLNKGHIVPIIFQADVMKPFVHLERHNLLFDDMDGELGRHMKLMNTLNVPIKYKWSVPADTCFIVKPLNGSIPVKRYTMCEITYKADPSKRSSSKFQCICSQGALTVLNLNAYIIKCDVEFLRNKVILDKIPINIPVYENNVLRNNAYESISFIIKNNKPFVGVTIEPAFGRIWGRSDFYLQIKVHLKFFVTFKCKVEAEFDHGNILTFIIQGSVDIPKLKFKPDSKKITLKRIPAESFDIAQFSIQNKGASEVRITYDRNIFPEICVTDQSVCSMNTYEHNGNFQVTLLPEEIIELYIHFYPLDVCMNDFFLPLIINDILGPPFKGEAESLKFATYTNAHEAEVNIEEFNAQLIKIKHPIPAFNVNAVSSRHVLRFNKTFFKFKYFPLETFPSRTQQDLKITNSLHREVEFSINTEGILPNFEIIPKDEDKWIFINTFMVCTAEPQEEITLSIIFLVNTPGIFTKKIEVYIKDIKQSQVFTYIKLRAKYLEATISLPAWATLDPVSINCRLEYEFTMELRNHLPECKLNIDCKDKELTLAVVETKEYSFFTEKKMKVLFYSSVAVKIFCKVIISCTCEATADIIITAYADENVASNYMHYTDNNYLQEIKSTNFPYFPDKTDKSTYAIYMRNCKRIVERWLHEQTLFMTFYYFIPDSLMGFYKHPTKAKNKEKILTIVKILQNICGNDVTSMIINREYPANASNLERISYVHATFKNIITFLRNQGAYFPHVRCKFLLEYEDYKIYVTKVRPLKLKETIEPVKFSIHYSRAEQAWLDLILQLFKTMVLSSVSFRKQRISNLSHNPSYFMNEAVLQNDSQQSLLAWLTVIYETQLNNLNNLDTHKPENFKPLTPRVITNFTSHLQDGLVFVAVTMNYCPYLKPYLQDIYLDIDDPDKAFHNAVLLTKAWNLIKCSFKIFPEEIINPSALQMLMFVNYLYVVFPNLVPRDELTFTVSLSYAEKKEILIKNPTTSDLHFEICCLGNKMDCFEIYPPKNLVVTPGREYKLKVTYMAKLMENQEAILLLSGDTPGQRYCKSLIYILKGITVYEKEFTNLVLHVDLYTMETRNIVIQTPYLCEATYDLVKDKCSLSNFRVETFKMWKDKHFIIKPRSLYCRERKLVTDETGIGTVVVTLCCLSVEMEEMLIVFSNEDIGDFIVTIVIQPANFHKIPKHNIEIDLPSNWDDCVCICNRDKFTDTEKCPRKVTLQIPCKNDYFWNIISKSLLLAVPENEHAIWTEYLNSEMGPYLLNWLLVTANESTIKHTFDSDITYTISNNNANLQFPHTVTVANIRACGCVPIRVHLNNNVVAGTKPYDFFLQSEDGAEYRVYSVTFKEGQHFLEIPTNEETNLCP